MERDTVERPSARRHWEGFVGRERELQELRDAFTLAAAGQGSMCLVGGEPGIGKTALLEVLADAVVEEGGRAVVGHCYAEASLAFPYQPFAQALSDLVADPARTAPESDGGLAVASLARIVSHGAGGAGTPAEERWGLFQAVVGFLGRVAHDQAVLLVLEDLHWADASTLDLLKHLAGAVGAMRVLVVGTYRDTELHPSHPLSGALAAIRRRIPMQRVVLEGLEADDVLRLLQRRHGELASRTAAGQLVRRTEGNPLFVHELLRSLGAHAPIEDEVVSVGVPPALREVIGQRLASIDADCRDTLEVAATLGRAFRYRTLRAASDLSDERLAGALEEAERASVIESGSSAGVLTFRFKHALFQEVLYEEMSATRRLSRHRRLARVLEAEYGERSEDHALELAEHLARCDDPADVARAVDWFEVAARRAMAVFAFGDAARLYRRALDLRDPSGEGEGRCRLLLGLEGAMIAEGRPIGGVQEVAREAFALAEALGNDALAFESCQLMLDSLIGAPGSDIPGWISRAERHVRGHPKRRMVLDFSRSTGALHSGEFEDARRLLESAAGLAVDLGEMNVQFAASSQLVRIGVLPDLEEQRLFERLEARAAVGLNANVLSVSYLDAVMTAMQAARRVEAERQHRALRSLADATSYAPALVNAAGSDMLFAVIDGRFGDARDAGARALSIGTFPHVWRARLAGWQDDRELLDAEIEWSGRLKMYSSVMYQAFSLAVGGRRDEARVALAGVVREFLARPRAAFSFLTLLLEAAVEAGDAASAELLVARTRSDRRRFAKPMAVVLPRQEGRAWDMLGDYEAARTSFEAAVGLCTRLKHRPELALTQLDLAELLFERFPREQARARRLLGLATASLEEMGMARGLEQSRALEQRTSVRREPDPTALSPRQEQVLGLIADGLTNREIAEELVLSLRTVERHVADIYGKIGVRNRSEATAYALRR